jgi:cytidine deaminase
MEKISDIVSEEDLIDAARRALDYARAPYSHFRVGAAALTSDGRVFTGCNVELSILSLTMCAERVAIFKAVSEGSPEIVKVAIVADHEEMAPPCGCCRQVIWEFGTDKTEVVLSNLNGGTRKIGIKDLLPDAFDARFLHGVR